MNTINPADLDALRAAWMRAAIRRGQPVDRRIARRAGIPTQPAAAALSRLRMR